MKLFLGWALCGLCLLGRCEAAERIEAWSYYLDPPYQLEQGDGAIGLSEELVAYLNKAFAGKYDIHLTAMPRARLNALIAKGDKGFVTFVSSKAFGGADRGDFLWTRPLLDDMQEIVWNTHRPIEFTGPKSLNGITFGIVRGHVYPELDKEIASKQIPLVVANDQHHLLLMLAAERVQAITIAQVVYNHYLAANPELEGKFGMSKISLGGYTHNLMFQKGMERERKDFDAVVARMESDPAWIATLKKFGLQPASHP